MPDARGVDMKIPSLRVLEKRRRDPRRERIRIDDDRLGVIRNQDVEEAVEEFPRGFARLNRARGRFLEGGIHETIGPNTAAVRIGGGAACGRAAAA